MKKLKIFKTWQVLGLFHGLDEIAQSLQLQRFEQEMINEEQAAKIQQLALNF